ncbi:hypothetical protein ElyMa_004742400 [Elysia marginata]|uniref:Uncharacterized protein n=1 Tax=Elysia marginata TaxID=1093978 RepID=A0AAV4ICS0_9GAST|nr:hypothetical protein ElyMa_004742400 [Elysia marginata]
MWKQVIVCTGGARSTGEYNKTGGGSRCCCHTSAVTFQTPGHKHHQCRDVLKSRKLLENSHTEHRQNPVQKGLNESILSQNCSMLITHHNQIPCHGLERSCLTVASTPLPSQVADERFRVVLEYTLPLKKATGDTSRDAESSL